MDLTDLKTEQTWLEVRSTAIARKLRAGNDPVLVEEKRAIQEQLINLAQEIEAQNERSTNGADVEGTQQNLDKDGAGATGE